MSTASHCSCCFSSFSLHISLFVEANVEDCKPNGYNRGTKPPPGQCNTQNNSDRCQDRKNYTTYSCSPPITNHTIAVLTINSFERGGDGGGLSECDLEYHPNELLIVALSAGGSTEKLGLPQHHYQGKCAALKATVVDECDSTLGCNKRHDYQPPWLINIGDASKAVWNALGVSHHDQKRGELYITWSDA